MKYNIKNEEITYNNKTKNPVKRQKYTKYIGKVFNDGWIYEGAAYDEDGRQYLFYKEDNKGNIKEAFVCDYTEFKQMLKESGF